MFTFFKKHAIKIQHHILNERYATNNAVLWGGEICNTLHSYAYYLNYIKIMYINFLHLLTKLLPLPINFALMIEEKSS